MNTARGCRGVFTSVLRLCFVCCSTFPSQASILGYLLIEPSLVVVLDPKNKCRICIDIMIAKKFKDEGDVRRYIYRGGKLGQLSMTCKSEQEAAEWLRWFAAVMTMVRIGLVQ